MLGWECLLRAPTLDAGCWVTLRTAYAGQRRGRFYDNASGLTVRSPKSGKSSTR